MKFFSTVRRAGVGIGMTLVLLLAVTSSTLLAQTFDPNAVTGGDGAQPFVVQPRAEAPAQARGTRAAADPAADARLQSLYTADFNTLLSTAEQGGSVRVIVELKAPKVTPNARHASAEAAEFSAIASTQNTVLGALQGTNFSGVLQYRSFPLMAVTVDAAGLRALQASSEVVSISRDGFRAPLMNTSNPQIGVTGPGGAISLGLTGIGQTVAVIDTGVDYNHLMLTGKLVAEGCYGLNTTIPDNTFGPVLVTSLCPGGAEASSAPGAGLNCTREFCDHGTHVAGTAVGNPLQVEFTNGTTAVVSGVAPGANLAAFQVFVQITNTGACNSFGYASPCVLTLDSLTIGALDRAYQIRKQINLAAVNLSLGGGEYTSQAQCMSDSANKPYKKAIKALVKGGVAVAAASGNNGFADAIGAPACIKQAISVGAVDDADEVAAFSNAYAQLDVLAPGVEVLSAIPGGVQNGPAEDTLGFLDGTSMASPHVAGAIAVLKSGNKSLTPKQIENALKNTGVPVTDPLNGLTFPRIELKGAIAATNGIAAPRIVSPADNSTLSLANPVVTFTASPTATEYKIVFKKGDKTKAKLKVPAASCASGTCTVTLTDVNKLKVGKKYKWSVKAMRGEARNKSAKVKVVIAP